MRGGGGGPLDWRGWSTDRSRQLKIGTDGNTHTPNIAKVDGRKPVRCHEVDGEACLLDTCTSEWPPATCSPPDCPTRPPPSKLQLLISSRPFCTQIVPRTRRELRRTGGPLPAISMAVRVRGAPAVSLTAVNREAPGSPTSVRRLLLMRLSQKTAKGCRHGVETGLVGVVAPDRSGGCRERTHHRMPCMPLVNATLSRGAGSPVCQPPPRHAPAPFASHDAPPACTMLPHDATSRCYRTTRRCRTTLPHDTLTSRSTCSPGERRISNGTPPASRAKAVSAYARLAFEGSASGVT